MIPERITEAYWVLPNTEPALYRLEDSKIEKYLLDRDIKALGVDMEKGTLDGEQVTLFKCEPLRQKYYNLLNWDEVDAAMKIFKHHVIQFKNAFDGFSINRDDDGTSYVSDFAMDKMGIDTVMDVAGVIAQRAKGVDGISHAFFVPVTSRRTRISSRLLPANLARIGPAKQEIE